MLLDVFAERAVLRLAPELPTVLCAAPAGAPLYRSLGFQTVADSYWWSL
ncbi:hypothetical protein [Streptomonospora litoralis]|nr:hypothetical protein [Streptomonospora litoralis]